MNYYQNSVSEVLKSLETDEKSGLSTEQALAKKEKFGENKLREKKKKSLLMRYLDQFKDVMILILIAAAIISFVVVCVKKNWKELFEPVLILLIVVLNAIMGVYQEGKAAKAMEALQKLSAPHARVIRDGVETVIEAKDLVPGDIILLEAGDYVPADARLIHSVGLKSEESALTGESVPTEKDYTAIIKEGSPLGDRDNMVYSGCVITYGTAKAVVTATGMDTEMGKIANLLDEEKEIQTPLQHKLAQLGKYLGVITILASVIVFIVGIASKTMEVLDIFMTAVSLGVAAIPEGLPVIVTIVLSIGVQRMAKKNALIRKLPAVETLGSASVICSDKTGTLTQNRMTLTKAFVDGSSQVELISATNSDQVKKLLTYGTLCCDGAIVVNEDSVQHIGDPTETAIIYAAYKNGIEQNDINEKYTRLGEIPFDSDRKLMSTINEINGEKILIVKGAFDVMATRCIAGDLDTARKVTEEMSSNALRVLAVAYKKLDSIPEKLDTDIENGLTFMGLVGMIDPPRPEAKAAVEICRMAGIKPVMITGDHIVTASAIAKELGILLDGDRAITGAQLDEMTDSELDEQVVNISVYARVSPENKIRIVKAWQRKGQVVSMTGDGVNDAPALKAADIGCAMGITGTDVAKGASDMTLTDDNFATIVDAVREGRGIYANIKKVVGFLLGTNIGEVVMVFFAMLLWQVTPLLSMQLLWINLVTDSLPAIALGMEAVESDVMEHKPKPKKEGLFAHGLGIRIVLQGFMFAILGLIGFKIGENVTGTLKGAQTLAFFVLASSQTIQAFNMRSDKSLFKIGFFTNKKLNWAVLISILLIALVVFTPVRIIFELVILPWKLYLVGLGLISVPLIIMEISKAIGLIKHHK